MVWIEAERLVARRIHIRGIVQGVGFRPYVFRLAQTHGLAGWVVNGDDGLRIHVEGSDVAVDEFLDDLREDAPPASRIDAMAVVAHEPLALVSFQIGDSVSMRPPTTHISPDLAICDDCLRELLDPGDARFHYPYINCTNCGPRYSIIRSLPYDRSRTTMAAWKLCPECAAEYRDPSNRRFHAQPVACPRCGPRYEPDAEDAARRLREGQIVAIKGLGGYHLACDAANAAAVTALRERKFRKEKPFAVMVRDISTAKHTVALSAAAEELLASPARPIVLAPGRIELAGVAPGTRELGVMLPYTPLHHLLFEYGGPDRIVMTSGNRSSEPIAYRDDDAVHRLNGIADAILIGERPIARRVDDSVVRMGVSGPVVLRRARGYSPGVVAHIPSARPVLALGADLKNAVTLVVDGQAMVSQHIGDLEHYDASVAFRETVDDLLSMYAVDRDDLVVAHDLHPQYASTRFASTLQAGTTRAVQHHRAHIASALAERGEFDARVIGVAFDGTGYGDDGSIWGGEFFAGSTRDGFTRVAHLRPAVLPGGDAAARWPVQAAAGFLLQLDALPDLAAGPFCFPRRYESARVLAARDVRSFRTTSAGRLFDTVAALLGFTRDVSYEGQAAIWLEQLARDSSAAGAFEFPFDRGELDWRPAINEVVAARKGSIDLRDIARMFHRGLAQAIANAALELAAAHHVSRVVLSGGVFQNTLLSSDIIASMSGGPVQVLTNSAVPPNDGGISLGQAAIAALWRSACTEAAHGDS